MAGIFFLLFSPVKASKVPPQKFIVQTHTFKQPSRSIAQPKKITQTPSNPPTKKPAVKKKSPAKKIEPKAAPVTRKPTPKQPATPPKKETPPADLQKQIVQELEELVAKIEKDQEKISPPAPLQETRSSLQDTAAIFIATPEERYQDALLSYLHEALHLPEQGEVKIQLSIQEDGTLAKIVVLKAESVKNRIYLEKQLPLLHFPDLQSLQVKEKVFVVTFCNEPKN
ncbi:MAG: hypothetical protein LVR00_08755 [Rhabdochlamydiaceae bacterium]